MMPGLPIGRKGDISWFLVLSIMALLALGVSIYYFNHIRDASSTLTNYISCDNGGFGFEGRCFAGTDCGNNLGWTAMPINVACPTETPHCCYLDDPDSYYPAGTLRFRVQAGNILKAPPATFRFVSHANVQTDKTPDLELESGSQATGAYYYASVLSAPVVKATGHELLKPFPARLPFIIEFKPPLKALYCQVTLTGTKAFPQEIMSCTHDADNVFVSMSSSISSFTDLVTQGKLDCSDAGSNTCKVGVSVSVADNKEMTGATVVGAGMPGSTASYILYFATK